MTLLVPYYYMVLKYMSAAKENRKQKGKPFKNSTILYPFPSNSTTEFKGGEGIFLCCQKSPTDLSGPSSRMKLFKANMLCFTCSFSHMRRWDATN